MKATLFITKDLTLLLKLSDKVREELLEAIESSKNLFIGEDLNGDPFALSLSDLLYMGSCDYEEYEEEDEEEYEDDEEYDEEEEDEYEDDEEYDEEEEDEYEDDEEYEDEEEDVLPVNVEINFSVKVT